MKVPTFPLAASDATAVGGGRRCGVEVDVHAPHMVSTDTTDVDPFSPTTVRVSAPGMAFSDNTMLVEWGHLVTA